MYFSEVEIRSLSQENVGLGFSELPGNIPSWAKQRCLEHRHAKLNAPRPARPAKQEPAASEAERNAVARRVIAARIRNLN